MVARTRLRLPLATALVFVAAAAPGHAQITSDPGFFGIQWKLRPNPACVEQEVVVEFTACRCNVELLEAGISSPDGIYLNARVRPDIVCVWCDPDTLTVPLGKLAAGKHEFQLLAHARVEPSDSIGFDAVRKDTLRLSVSPTCPPPPPGDPPFVDRVQIGLGAPCLECPARACAGDSIPVSLSGVLPDNCIEFAGVEVIPSTVLGPQPTPPILRVHFTTNSCLGRPCILIPIPWAAQVKIPALPERLDPPYRLWVESEVRDLCLQPDSLPHLLGSKDFAFTVTPCSLSTPGCFLQGWVGSPGLCQATIREGGSAKLTMGLATDRPVAALEGNLRFDPPGLRVADLRPGAAAAGLKLEWTATADGARFVLFSVDGTTIPVPDPIRMLPILDIEVSAPAGSPVPEVTRLLALDLLVSDETGQTVPPCAVWDLRIADPAARICRASLCDFNRDGRADVRDLVLLVRCVLGEGPCPDGGGAEPADCDRGGTWDLDDVYCCARVVLQGGQPDPGDGRPEPGVTVTLGAPQRGGAETVQVPVLLHGADRVGAARLVVTYPSERYEVDGVDYPALGAAWIGLSEIGSGQVVLGFVGLAAEGTSPEGDLSAVVRLRLKAGQAHGGDASLVATEFAGPDGVGLLTEAGGPSVPLAPFVGVRLGGAHPNPFRDEVRFSVQLSEAANVDVAVYDVSGRRVAELFRGHAEAGAFDLTWRGRATDGSLSPSGVYLLRAVGPLGTDTRKVQLLRGE